MATALDYITDALERINAYAPGESLAPLDAARGLSLLNDLMDSLSNEHLACYQRVENIVNLASGQGIYTIGTPTGGTFLGTLVSGSNVISGVTAMPAGVVIGGALTAAGIPAGATITGIGTNTITMSLPATATYSVAQSFSFTIPGNFAIQRPLRVINGFTRITTGGYSSIDYPLEVISVDQWSSIGLKNQPGPWPKVVYYDQSYPLGTMYFWPCPSQAGELHLWTDNLFSDALTVNTVMSLPQGYKRFLTLALALECCPGWGKTPSPLLVQQYKDAKAAVKNLNAQAQSVATYDGAITGRAHADAGWFLHGGFQ